MNIRNQVEDALRAWNAHEVARHGSPVIDYFCLPELAVEVQPTGRLETLNRLDKLVADASDADESAVALTARAHAAYIRALLGEHTTIEKYIRDTQGCSANGWSESHLEAIRTSAVEAVEALGMKWGTNLEQELEANEGGLTLPEAIETIQHEAATHESAVRSITGTSSRYDLTVEAVNVDSYWSYWLDGVGDTVRLRLNLRNARFTRVQARQFALHEVLGHALQSASYADRCREDEVPWVRLLAVHTPYQVLLEGLAQALPLFVCRNDAELTARVKLDRLRQLTFANIHLAINQGRSVEECYTFATKVMPFWTPSRVEDALADRSVNPQLRSYLWAYPAGLDWFASLAATGSRIQAQEVLHAAYHDPLCPAELEALWPSGPTIGGA